MSYAPSGYIVDLDKLVAIYGSKKPAFVKTLLAKRAAEVKQNTEWFAGEIAKGAPTLDVAVREIVDGKCTHKQHGFQYVYALELISGHIGTTLFAADFINGGFLDVLQSELPKPVRKLLTTKFASEAKPPVPIPMPKHGAPGLGVFDRDQCKTISDALKAIRLGEDSDFDLADGIDEIKGWFGRAAKARRGLLMFWY